MNEKLQYAEMLEIPLSTCNVSYQKPKKKLFGGRKKPQTDVKAELVDKINQNASQEVQPKSETEVIQEKIDELAPISSASPEENASLPENTLVEVEKEDETVRIRSVKKPKFKVNVFAVQFIVIGVLLATILLTNALLPNSAINTFISQVFGNNTAETQVVDQRQYQDFTANLPVNSGATLTDGVITFGAQGSVYSPCEGMVSSVSEKDGKWCVEIAHNQNFTTVLSGLDYAYFNTGDKVFSNVPVGYVKGDATMCFLNGEGDMITNYTLGENTVQWMV